MDNIVNLNVGGKKFTSSRDTICKVRRSPTPAQPPKQPLLSGLSSAEQRPKSNCDSRTAMYNCKAPSAERIASASTEKYFPKKRLTKPSVEGGADVAEDGVVHLDFALLFV